MTAVGHNYAIHRAVNWMTEAVPDTRLALWSAAQTRVVWRVTELNDGSLNECGAAAK